MVPPWEEWLSCKLDLSGLSEVRTIVTTLLPTYLSTYDDECPILVNCLILL